MSLNRLIARIAAVSALNNFMQQPWPTIAGPNIFDSKIEPVEDMKSDQVFPCCVVYTDYDKDAWIKGSRIHEERILTLTLELLIVQAEEDGDVYRLDCPVADSEIETSLDIFETQIYRAFSKGTSASDAFNYICPTYSNVVSRRGASVEGGQRLAARQVTLEMKAIRDNIAGVIPEPIDAFLSELERYEDYAPRVPEIRDLMRAPSDETAAERAMRAFGYPTRVAERLALELGPVVKLPRNLTFHYKGISQ